MQLILLETIDCSPTLDKEDGWMERAHTNYHHMYGTTCDRELGLL